MPRKRRCPRCQGTSIVPIVHGMPTPDMEERRARGEVELGGCMVGLNPDPRWRCQACGWRWPAAEWFPQDDWREVGP